MLKRGFTKGYASALTRGVSQSEADGYAKLLHKYAQTLNNPRAKAMKDLAGLWV